MQDNERRIYILCQVQDHYGPYEGYSVEVEVTHVYTATTSLEAAMFWEASGEGRFFLSPFLNGPVEPKELGLNKRSKRAAAFVAQLNGLMEEEEV